MALITCSECGGQVSRTASACPHCGAPVSVAPAVEERKCAECGAVLPEGAAACPTCGCPAEIKPVQPAAAPRPAYTAPTVAPARVRLGEAKLRIVDNVARKTANANVWLFFATAVTFVLYIIMFVKYMNFFTLVEDTKKNWLVQIGAAVVDSKTDGAVSKFFNTCTVVKWLVIGALVVAALAFIGGLVQLSKKQRMSQCLWAFPILDIAGFWIPNGLAFGLTSLKSKETQDALDFITDTKFRIYIAIAPTVIVVLFFISIAVCFSIPKVTDFCSHCGRYIRNEGAGGVCKGCGERKYIPGFTPIPRDVVAAYPYSGETLVGQSPARGAHVFFIAFIDIVLGGIAILLFTIGKVALCIFISSVLLAFAIFFTVTQVRKGVCDSITVTPTSIKLRSINGSLSLNVPISEITDVLSNESGDLAICAHGVAAIFTDLSERTQIAAALASLTENNQIT